MSDINQQRDRAVNALRQKLENTYNEIDYKFDALLREVYGLPDRPKESEPYNWLVGADSSKEELPSKKIQDAYKKSLSFVLRWEGGYVNHPNDKGGATKKGVTQSTYNYYRSRVGLQTQSIRDITDREVEQIYKEQYWLAAKCDLISQSSPHLAIAHMDWAVNAGVGRAIKTLQYCIGTTVDGVWGPYTSKAFASVANKSERLNCYLQRREQLYRRWGRGSQSVFLQGWLNRLNDLKQYLQEV